MTESPHTRNSGNHGITAVRDALNNLLVLLKIAMAALIAAFCMSGIRNLEQYEAAVIFRFGAIHGDAIEEPGLILALPFPIDEIRKVPARRTRIIESDTFWYAVTDDEAVGGKAAIPDTLNPETDGYVITADRGLIHVRSKLNYRIHNPIHHIVSHSDVAAALRHILDNAVLKTLSERTMADVLASKTSVSATITERVRDAAADMQLGVAVDPVDLALQWPRQLAGTMNEVVRANQETGRSLAEARIFAANQENEAIGKAAKVTATAMAAATRVVSRAEADAATFKKLYPIYRRNPNVIRSTLYQDRMRKIMANVDEVFIIDKKGNREIRLNLPRKRSQTQNKDTAVDAQ